jgi:hypothetical protein
MNPLSKLKLFDPIANIWRQILAKQLGISELTVTLGEI